MTNHKYRGLPCVLILVFIGMWGCGSPKKTATFEKPVQAPPAPAAPSKPTEVDNVIAKARELYFLGERERNLGHLEKAKEAFDASLDTLMTYQSTHDPNQKIEAVIDELEDKIFQHEMAALKEGDGFTEHPLEPALIDDLKNIDTFPPPDQATKQEVEEELKTVSYDIPVELNDKVLSFIRIFQHSRRGEFEGGLYRSGRYLDLMKQIFREEGVPEDLVYTALIESSFKSNAYSRARAKGFWQFISGTARRYGLKMDWWIDERSDFIKSTRAAARYLKDLHEMFNDWYLALAGYNAGENKILYGIRRSGANNFWRLATTRYIRQETKNYVPAILAAMIIAKDPQKYGFNTVPDRSVQYDVVKVDYTVDLRLVAECSGATLEEIKMLNPELNRLTTPSRSSSYSLRIPKNTTEVFLTEISGIPEDKRITWRKHEVKEGETLTQIAATYRTSSDSIMAANAMKSDGVLNIGEKIVIPMRATPTVSYETTSKYTSAPGQKNYHSVRSGETLSTIAQRYGVSIKQLCAWNNVSPRTTLKIGRSLIVRYSSSTATNSTGKKKIYYQVKRGDTLYQIADNYNIDVESIRKWNKIGPNNTLQPGDRLTIYHK